MRSDLSQLRLDEQEIAELQLLLTPRRDLVTDHSRIVTRLRETLVSLFSGFGAGTESERQRSPHTPHSLPDSHAP
jgi:hypothetical protein